jgi:hypothetical protein
MEGIPLFVTTLGLTAGLAFMLVSGDIQNIKENWDTRRCELPIMIMGSLFKPNSFEGSPSDFSTENMNFCTRQMAKSVLIMLLAPVTAILGNQSDVLGVLGNSLNMMRTLLSNATGSFGKLIEPFYRRFLLIGGNFRVVFQQFLSAMNRVFAIAISQLFMGISAVVGMQNVVSFVIKVVMIVMGVIIAIFILLFFVLAPFLPMILTVIGVLASVGVAVSGTEVFCFSPDTEILMANSVTKPISQIRAGDFLPHKGVVEGVLLTIRDPKIPMFSYKGVLVSGSHLVWENGKWIAVNRSEKAQKVYYEGERLYSLRTTSREIFAKSSSTYDIVLFKDWEEIPPGNDDLDADWDVLVQHILGNNHIEEIPSTTDPLFSPNCFVVKNSRLVPISTIQIGDLIGINMKGDKTRVLGIYTGQVIIDQTISQDKWHTDGVWWKRDRDWLHTPTRAITKKVTAQGVHLITDSGVFWVHAGTHSGIVRDFTEVGSDKIVEATEMILSYLNEKPKP